MFVCGHKLPCHHNEYQIRQECCPRCPPGNRVEADCTEFRNRTCLPCREGTFMSQPTGRRLCYFCSRCDAGSGLKIKRACTTTSDTVCEPLDGFYCMKSAEDGCRTAKKHTSCSPGQYIRQRGTSSRDTECSDCSDGTYSDGTFTSCQTHTQCESLNRQLIKAGNVSTDAECEESLNWTGLVIGIVVQLLFFLFIGPVIYHLIKKRYLNPDGQAYNLDQICPFVPLNGWGNQASSG